MKAARLVLIGNEVNAGDHRGVLGRRAMRLALLGAEVPDAATALGEGLADALVPDGDDPLEWARGWRSEPAV